MESKCWTVCVHYIMINNSRADIHQIMEKSVICNIFIDSSILSNLALRSGLWDSSVHIYLELFMPLPDLHNCFSESLLKQGKQFMHINTVSDRNTLLVNSCTLFFSVFPHMTLTDPDNFTADWNACVAGQCQVGLVCVDATGRVCHSLTLHHHRGRC